MIQRTKLASALLTFALVFSLTAWSQEKPASHAAQPSANASEQSPEHYLRLDFRVLDVSPQGKVVNSHVYHEMIAEGTKNHPSSIRSGDRVAIPTGTYQTDNSTHVNTSFQYIQAETDIDVSHATVVNDALRLSVMMDIRTFASQSPYMPTNMKEPIVRHVTWNSRVTVPIHKPTIIFSADNNTDKGKIQLELTAIPVTQ